MYEIYLLATMILFGYCVPFSFHTKTLVFWTEKQVVFVTNSRLLITGTHTFCYCYLNMKVLCNIIRQLDFFSAEDVRNSFFFYFTCSSLILLYLAQHLLKDVGSLESDIQ